MEVLKGISQGAASIFYRGPDSNVVSYTLFSLRSLENIKLLVDLYQNN